MQCDEPRSFKVVSLHIKAVLEAPAFQNLSRSLHFLFPLEQVPDDLLSVPAYLAMATEVQLGVEVGEVIIGQAVSGKSDPLLLSQEVVEHIVVKGHVHHHQCQHLLKLQEVLNFLLCLIMKLQLLVT